MIGCGFSMCCNFVKNLVVRKFFNQSKRFFTKSWALQQIKNHKFIFYTNENIPFHDLISSTNETICQELSLTLILTLTTTCTPAQELTSIISPIISPKYNHMARGCDTHKITNTRGQTRPWYHVVNACSVPKTQRPKNSLGGSPIVQMRCR